MNEFVSKIETLNLSQVQLEPEYRTGQTDLVGEFYRPCLFNSTSYDRAVGYFRSTVFLLVSDAVLRFVKRGGHIRLICSPSLSEQDIEAIKAGYKSRENAVLEALDQEVEFLLNSSDLINRTKILATMIALGAMDVKLAIRPSESGIYHEKLGVFKDSNKNIVSFKGSSNETWNAWHAEGNYESIEVFCSWREKDVDRANRHAEYFESLWSNKISDVVTIEFPEAVLKKLYKIATDNLDNIKVDILGQNLKKSSGREPFPHQIEALENWKNQNSRGILQHATGSGKTFTAIVALREHLKFGGTALVVVPSKLLLRQWTKELKDEILNLSLLKAGDGNNNWRESNLLRDFTIQDCDLPPRIVLSTIQTASTDGFIDKISSGDHLLIVADEVHQTGSLENSKVYRINAGKRLGLSATPIRYGDSDGTARMFSYFGNVVAPIFTLQDAIKSGRLVEYEYYPHAINLNAQEAETWKNLSDQISREVARSPRDGNGKCTISERARNLLIQRARVAKKANAKILLAERILSKEYVEGEKWLVYCEDKDQLSEIVDRLSKLNLHVNEYHTAMSSDMNATLEWFKTHGGILVSIRCLDEGVDIPDISHALILASSQNPRQFIQRRGRVLRRAPGKLKATLHDAIVVPIDLEKEAEQLVLVKSEFCRAIEFAEGAINKSSAAHLTKIAIELGLNIEDIANIGIESEEQ